MTFVVTEACIRCQYTDCVSVCPVDCFHEGPNFLVIDPEVCIDCSLCVPECPVDAIFSELELPAAQVRFAELNARYAARWPAMAARRKPPDDADEWRTVRHKLDELRGVE